MVLMQLCLRISVRIGIIGNRVRIPDDPVAVLEMRSFSRRAVTVAIWEDERMQRAEVRRPAFLPGIIGPAMDGRL